MHTAFNALILPLLLKYLHAFAHGNRHGDAADTVVFDAFAVAVTKNHHNPIAHEFIDGAAVLIDDFRHFFEVGVKDLGEGFRFKLFRQLAEVLDVRKEDGESFSLCLLGGVFAFINGRPNRRT